MINRGFTLVSSHKKSNIETISGHLRVLAGIIEAGFFSNLINKIKNTLSKIPQIQEVLGMLSGMDPKKAIEKLKKSLGKIDLETFKAAKNLIKHGPQKTSNLTDLKDFKRTVIMAVLIMIVSFLGKVKADDLTYETFNDSIQSTDSLLPPDPEGFWVEPDSTKEDVKPTPDPKMAEIIKWTKYFYEVVLDQGPQGDRIIPMGNDELLDALKKGEVKTKEDYLKWDAERLLRDHPRAVKKVKDDFKKGVDLSTKKYVESFAGVFPGVIVKIRNAVKDGYL